jgi:ATP-dependent DNA ligase
MAGAPAGSPTSTSGRVTRRAPFGEPGGFVMIGKTFKGLTDQTLRWQTETFPGYAVRETPGVVWLRPEIVVEIAIDGVQRSSRYPGGVALRFARVKGLSRRQVSGRGGHHRVGPLAPALSWSGAPVR